MPRFNIDDLDRSINSAAEEAMLALVLAWAHLDGALSMWVGVKFGVPADKMAILLGRSDATSKLMKLQRVYALEGDQLEAAKIKAIKKAYEKHVRPRNLVAHASYRGCMKSEPDRIIFASYEAVTQGELAIDAVPIEEMERSTAWANLLSGRVERLINILDPLPMGPSKNN
jgi:hypothetical protein